MVNPVYIDDDGILLCPQCKTSGYLHQIELEIFNRTEDAKTGQHIIATVGQGYAKEGGGYAFIPDKTTIDSDVSAAPGRRQSVLIRFICEGCSNPDPMPLRLVIIQHKGNTYMSWE